MARSPARILIVGAGPAGLRAAEMLAEAGLSPILVDEAPRVGGQIYRQPPRVPGFMRTATQLYGAAADRARDLFVTFDRIRNRIDYRPGSLVYDLIDNRAVIARDGKSEEIVFDALILATGAMDRIAPAPGWTLPGVYTLGAAQIALKHQGCAIGQRVAFIGTGPLLLLAAHQYAKVGAVPAAVVVPSHFRSFAAAALRLIGMPRELSLGLYWLLDLKRRGVPILFGHRLSEVIGDESVRAVRVRMRGEQREIACDAVAIGYGLQSETQLADLAGVKFAFDAVRRQWLPETDPLGRAIGRNDVYLAGDGAGMLGADAAEARGRLAAHALMMDLDISHVTYKPKPDLDAVDRAEHLQLAMRAAFELPDDFFAAVSDETLVCRCEQVLAGELRGVAGLMGARELNRAKSYSRVGMGRCQGRLCGHAAAEILADKLGVTLDSVGRMRGQPPIKPVSVATVAERRP